jgi:hypothetical protein
MKSNEVFWRILNKIKDCIKFDSHALPPFFTGPREALENFGPVRPFPSESPVSPQRPLIMRAFFDKILTMEA